MIAHVTVGAEDIAIEEGAWTASGIVKERGVLRLNL